MLAASLAVACAAPSDEEVEAKAYELAGMAMPLMLAAGFSSDEECQKIFVTFEEGQGFDEDSRSQMSNREAMAELKKMDKKVAEFEDELRDAGCIDGSGGSDGAKAPTPSDSDQAQDGAPAPIDLATTDHASLWIFLHDGEFFLTARADPAFDVREYRLELLIDGKGYCNTTNIYHDDGPVELGCQSEERSHSTVDRVSALTPHGDLRCAKNRESTPRVSVFACEWR